MFFIKVMEGIQYLLKCKMFVVTVCFLISEIVVNTECTKPRSVNLALETVLSFDNKDISTDVKFLDDVQDFLTKVRKVVTEDKRKSARKHLFEKNNIQFTHFVKYLINILKTFNNDDLEDIFAVIDDEIRKYHYKGCKFYELVENHDVRRFVANTLDSVKAKPATVIRKHIEDALQVIEDAKYDKKQAEFLDYINSLYGYDSGKKLKKILDSLQVYRSKSKRANTDLIKLVRESIRTVIFDHYSDLNANARRDFKLKLETFWKDLKNPEKVNYNVWTMKYTHMQDRKQQTKKIREYNKKARPNKSIRESNTNTIAYKTDYTTPKPKKEFKNNNTLNKYTPKDISRSNEDYIITKKSKPKKNKVKSKSNKRYKIEKTTKSKGDDGSESDVSKVTAHFDSSKKHKRPHKKAKHYKNKHKKSHDSTTSENNEDFDIHKNVKSSDMSDDLSFTATKMRNSHRKQISTFITLYPEEILYTTEKRRFIDEFANETSPQTMRDKKVKINPKEVTHLMSVHNAEINVEGLMPSFYESESENFRANDNEQNVKTTRDKKRFKVEKKQRNDPKPKTHHRFKNFEATTVREQKPLTRATTPNKERYDEPTYRTAISEEGLSIESYGIIQSNRTFRKSYDDDTFTNSNELRQINNTEKQLEDKNLTTHLTEAYKTLNFWEGTTKTIENTTTEISTINYSIHSNSTTIFHINMTNVKEVNTTQNRTEAVIETTTVDVISKDAKSEINRNKVIPLIDVRNNEIEGDKNNDINTFNEALENIFVKYNVTKPLETTAIFHMNILNETTPETAMKKNIIKDRVDQDLEKIFAEKRSNYTKPSVLADGYDDSDMFKGLEDLDL